MDTINLRVSKSKSITKTIATIRKDYPDSMTVIKGRIENHEPVLAVDYCELSGIRKILNLYKKLNALGDELDFYENDEKVDLELVLNLLE